jgi:hypothetical protein
MLKHIKLSNVGPSDEMSMAFGPRLNLLTGDNGLGKSFLLDIAWWALTRKWPNEINPRLNAGKKALPNDAGEGKIEFSFTSKVRTEVYESTYVPREQAWTGRAGRPSNPGLVIYAMADGSFALWDPARNYWRTRDGMDVQDRLPAYVLGPNEVWDGLAVANGPGFVCNGLIRDWASWQRENGPPFQYLKNLIALLSPADHEPLAIGELTRISLDDVRDMPSIRMAYGRDVPILHASAGIRRIIALAYFLVWAWEEHKRAAQLLKEPFAHQFVFLVDEIEAHLHPSWQRSIVPALLGVIPQLDHVADVQIVAATHSPLVMTSLEPIFDAAQDAWFHLDLVGGNGQPPHVELTQRIFLHQGDASAWLTSDAFDLRSARTALC